MPDKWPDKWTGIIYIIAVAKCRVEKCKLPNADKKEKWENENK